MAQKGLPPLSLHPPDNLIASYQDQFKQSVLNEMLTLLVQKQYVTVMSEGEVGFFSRVFLVPKKSGGFRLVIDLSALNEWLAPVTFTMDTLKVVNETVQEGMWATSLDLSDAYHHIPDSSTVSEIPVFSSRRPQVSPYSTTVWPDVGSVGVHGGSEANKEVDGAVRHHPLPISGRLAECAPVSSSMRVSHAGIDASLYATRTPSQRVEVGVRAHTIHSVPRRESLDLLHSRAYLVPERRASHPIERRSGDPARGPPVLQSGVATRSTGLRISDSSVRSPPSPQSSDKSNSGGSTRVAIPARG